MVYIKVKIQEKQKTYENNVLTASVDPPIRTVSVLTTLSFAVNPVISAVETLQSPNPKGLNIGAIIPPKSARRLFDESETGLSLKSKL